MSKRIKLLAAAAVMGLSAVAQTWVWYPGDFEIWLGNRMNNNRTERGAFFPPFWKTDSHFVTVEFSKDIDIPEDEVITIKAEGKYNVKLDGKLQFGEPSEFTLPAGRHKLNIKVWNQSTPPALYVKGKTVNSDSSWRVTNEDKEWIDESGKASDTSATTYAVAGTWNFDDIDTPPSAYALLTEPKEKISSELKTADGGCLYDFGRETFGSIVLKNPVGNGVVNIFYGESPEEALDKDYCETLDKISFTSDQVINLATNEVSERVGDYALSTTKAFRYVYVEPEAGMAFDDVAMLYEYAPVEYRGSFRCSDPELNDIWDVGAYTMHLTTREFFIDGIKRDRWVWSGDAVQSYLMNYYLFFDSPTVKRTTRLLRGKDPVTAHINTIMDYTLYWFIGIYDYYLYTGDKEFVKEIYPRMQTLMDYVLSRTNSDGMLEGMTGDWVFVDWADFPMSKQGALSFEQVLLCKSLETMKLCADIVGDKADAALYGNLAADLRGKLKPTFWDAERKALVHNVENGKKSDQVNKFANMFAITFGYFDDATTDTVMQQVMLNPDVPAITTPYMLFYELEAMCDQGLQRRVLKEMKDYWGGMLKEGATSFWEKYNPEDSGSQHLAMYGRPYGKSLCHAWGASPIYLIGKYFLGVKPVRPGYEEFSITPDLGGLKWMEGTVPTPDGEISLYVDRKEIKVKATQGHGYLYFRSKSLPKSDYGTVEKTGPDSYKLYIDTDRQISVKYRSIKS
ncbi:MAG: alpha-rhamnosidase [Muribaculaceae bacterium]|nr:alpha-rhamnosidase [Muribaculaceae bacterium]